MIKTEKAELFLPSQNYLGEGSRWNVNEQRLYWVDIEKGYYHWIEPATGKQQSYNVGQMVGVLAFCTSGKLVMGVQDGIAMWDTRARKLTVVASPEKGKPGARFNDGAVDPQGRFWAGTMTYDEVATSSLYRLDPDGSLHTMEQGLTISNGIGWSPDGKTMYLTDTRRRLIYAYDFDGATGSISNRRNFVQVPNDQGFPDGMTVDSEGFVWSAHFAGSCVVRYDPDGKPERKIELPASHVTCCAFGGPDLTDLYITTAYNEMSKEEHAREPLAGDLFHLRTSIKGVAQPKFKG